MSRLIHRIGKFIDIIKVTAESHGDNLEIIKDLHKEGCDLMLRADRLPQAGISVDELEAFEDAYNDLSRTLLELLNKKGILSKIGQARRSLKVEIPTFSGNQEAYSAWLTDFQQVTRDLPEADKKISLVQALKSNDKLQKKIQLSHSYQAALSILNVVFGDQDVQLNLLIKQIQSLSTPLEHEYQKEVANIYLIESYLLGMQRYDKGKSFSFLERAYLCGRLRPSNSEKLLGQKLQTIQEFSEAISQIYLNSSRVINNLKITANLTSSKIAGNVGHLSQASTGGTRAKARDRPPKREKEKSACLYCNNVGHSIGECPDIPRDSPESIKEQLRSRKVCFSCLTPFQPGHFRNCKGNKLKCSHCYLNKRVCICDLGRAQSQVVKSDKTGSIIGHASIISCSSVLHIPQSKGVLAAESIQIVSSPSESSAQVATLTALYDNGSNATLLSDDFLSFLQDTQPLTASVSNLNNNSVQNIYEGTLLIKFVDRIIGVHTYCMALSKVLLDTIEIEIPRACVKKYNLQKSDQSAKNTVSYQYYSG